MSENTNERELAFNENRSIEGYTDNQDLTITKLWFELGYRAGLAHKKNESIASSQTRAAALEEAAQTIESYSLAEKLARLTMENPVTHGINVTRAMANSIRALIKAE